MNTVTREHLASIEDVKRSVELIYACDSPVRRTLEALIAQASAAPGQEAAREFAEVEIFMDGGHKCFRFDEYCHAYSFPVGTHFLYTHADPSEVERLRAELAEWSPTMQRLGDQNQELRQDLAEAQALLRDLRGWIYRTSFHGTDAVALMDKIDAFLSAKAQPAEVKS